LELQIEFGDEEGAELALERRREMRREGTAKCGCARKLFRTGRDVRKK
jgi:hypothetical protein